MFPPVEDDVKKIKVDGLLDLLEMDSGEMNKHIENVETSIVSGDTESDADPDIYGQIRIQDLLSSISSDTVVSPNNFGVVSDSSTGESDACIPEMFNSVDFSSEDTLESLGKLKEALQGQIQQAASSMGLPSTDEVPQPTQSKDTTGRKRKRPSRSKKLQGLPPEEAEQRRLRTNYMEKERMKGQRVAVKNLESCLPGFFKERNEKSYLNTIKLSGHYIWLLGLAKAMGTSLDGLAFRLGLDAIRKAMESKWKDQVIDFTAFSHLFEQNGSMFSSLKEGSVFNTDEVMIACSHKHSHALLYAFRVEAANATPGHDALYLPSLSVYQPSAIPPSGPHGPLGSNHCPTWTQAPQYAMAYSHGQPSGQTPTIMGPVPQPVGNYLRFLPNQLNNGSGVQRNMPHAKSRNDAELQPNLVPSYHNSTLVPSISQQIQRSFSSAHHVESGASSRLRNDTSSSSRYRQSQPISGTASAPFQYTPHKDIPVLPSGQKRNYITAFDINSLNHGPNNLDATNQHEIAHIHPLAHFGPAPMHSSAPSLNATVASAQNKFTRNRHHVQNHGFAPHLNYISFSDPLPRTPFSELGPNTQANGGIDVAQDSPNGNMRQQLMGQPSMTMHIDENAVWQNLFEQFLD